MSGGIQKYPPSGASTPPNFPPSPPQPPAPAPPKPPSPSAPPTGSVIVAGAGGLIHNLDDQIK